MSQDVNRRIRQKTESRIVYYADHLDEIDHRLRELDREWDIERAIEANASTLALAGVALGVTSDRRWLALPDWLWDSSFSTPFKAGAP